MEPAWMGLTRKITASKYFAHISPHTLSAPKKPAGHNEDVNFRSGFVHNKIGVGGSQRSDIMEIWDQKWSSSVQGKKYGVGWVKRHQMIWFVLHKEVSSPNFLWRRVGLKFVFVIVAAGQWASCCTAAKVWWNWRNWLKVHSRVQLAGVLQKPNWNWPTLSATKLNNLTWGENHTNPKPFSMSCELWHSPTPLVMKF